MALEPRRLPDSSTTMFQHLVQLFHLVCKLLKAIHDLPFYYHLIGQHFVLPRVFKLLCCVWYRLLTIATYSPPDPTTFTRPQALENELLLLILSFLFNSFDDRFKEQRQAIACEKVCRSWFKAVRVLRRIAVETRGHKWSDSGLQAICSTTERLYLCEEPDSLAFWKDSKTVGRSKRVIGMCPNLRQLELAIPIRLALGLFHHSPGDSMFSNLFYRLPNYENITELVLNGANSSKAASRNYLDFLILCLSFVIENVFQLSRLYHYPGEERSQTYQL